MLKKTITFNDYNGVERTEDHYFNLTEAEIMKMEMSVSGGLIEKINRISAAQDAPEIIETFEEFIIKSYGVKSPDGKRFMKKKPDGTLYADEFKETEAYSQLFIELATDAKKAADFINAVVPDKKTEETPATIAAK